MLEPGGRLLRATGDLFSFCFCKPAFGVELTGRGTEEYLALLEVFESFPVPVPESQHQHAFGESAAKV